MKTLRLEVKHPFVAQGKNHINSEKSNTKDAQHPNHIVWPPGAVGDGGCGCGATAPPSLWGGGGRQWEAGGGHPDDTCICSSISQVSTNPNYSSSSHATE